MDEDVESKEHNTMNQIGSQTPLAGVLIFVAIFIGYGLYVLLDQMLELHRGKKSTAWPATQGIVTYSTMHEHIRLRDFFNRRSKPAYSVEILYEYTDGTAKYECERLAFGIELHLVSRKEAEELADKYREGTEVVVYYNPDNPKDATLNKGILPKRFSAGWAYGLLAIGVGLLLLLAAMLRSS
jgi:hypothetical protein